jgi:hypothetical protein
MNYFPRTANRSIIYVLIDVEAIAEIVGFFFFVSYAYAHPELSGPNCQEYLRGNAALCIGFFVIFLTSFNSIWLVYRTKNIIIIKRFFTTLVEEKNRAHELGWQATVKAGATRLSYSILGAILMILSFHFMSRIIRALGY